MPSSFKNQKSSFLNPASVSVGLSRRGLDKSPEPRLRPNATQFSFVARQSPINRPVNRSVIRLISGQRPERLPSPVRRAGTSVDLRHGVPALRTGLGNLLGRCPGTHSNYVRRRFPVISTECHWALAAISAAMNPHLRATANFKNAAAGVVVGTGGGQPVNSQRPFDPRGKS